MRGWKKLFCEKRNQKKAGVAILISDKTDFKIKTIIRDKGHYIMINGTIQEEDITIVNIYAGTSLVVQWLRICLPMQGTWVRALVWEDPTCRGATKPMHHNH